MCETKVANPQELNWGSSDLQDSTAQYSTVQKSTLCQLLRVKDPPKKEKTLVKCHELYIATTTLPKLLTHSILQGHFDHQINYFI